MSKSISGWRLTEDFAFEFVDGDTGGDGDIQAFFGTKVGNVDDLIGSF